MNERAVIITRLVISVIGMTVLIFIVGYNTRQIHVINEKRLQTMERKFITEIDQRTIDRFTGEEYREHLKKYHGEK